MGHGAGHATGHMQVPLAKKQIPNIDPDSLARWVDALPMPQIARPVERRAAPDGSGKSVPFYRVSMRAASMKVHRDLPATNFWAFGGAVPGVQFETRSGEGQLIEWANELPAKHFLPIDHTLHGAEKGLPEARGIVHLHGGRTPADSDGYPEDWYAPGQSRTYYYPNRQDAALLWYHDHAMGINRLNMYAGLFGLYVVRDEAEDALGLPSGKYEIPLVLADRDFTPDGQLSYPISAYPGQPWVPEAFGEAHLVNGKLYPYLDVEARRYRFRILNAANGRFYRLSLSGGGEITQIGSDQGLLSAPVKLKYLQLAPGERADVVIDFAEHRGEKLVLGSEPFELVQFRVSAQAANDTSSLPATLRPVQRIGESNAVQTRRLTLDENLNLVAESKGMLLNNTPWHAPITEKPVLDTTEIWELVNLTDDVHPIHLHMVRFQVLDRRKFDAFDYMNYDKLRFTSEPLAPDANEMGWKDTVRVNSHTVTRIIVPFAGYAGKYVWHCHILEHEDNEMMRPYEVVAAKS
ncbi:multicopper oxidase family protein [Terracidiphilus gabretensis]|uniref:multicopper oxidase family protein n=1 Tax=Terracidiphilus gabretensis TaxID=1577687 RepID=UPI00071B0A8C|nr:multicopper oxidase domain-containing protein [Terracidiphilus gabretensis]